MTPPKDFQFDSQKIILGAMKGSKAVKNYFKDKEKTTKTRSRSKK